MSITIRDIARMANTSTATVSRVLSGKGGVTPATRQRIEELVTQLGYTPNRLAQNLALKKSNTIGIIVSNLENSIYVEFFRHVERHLRGKGYQVLLADSEMDVDKERCNIQVMREYRADGLLIFPVHDGDIHTDIDHLLELKIAHYPFVLIGQLEGTAFDWVTSEEVDSAYRLTRYVIEMGHRRVGFLGCSRENRCTLQRYTGICHAMSEAGLELEGELIDQPETWDPIIEAMLSKQDHPSVVIATNDVLAVVIIRKLREMGFEVPRDLSIVSFDDSAWSKHILPALTTNRVNYEEVGRLALELLLRRIEEGPGIPEQHLVPQTLIERESCQPPVEILVC